MLEETEKGLKVTNSTALHNFYLYVEVSIMPPNSYCRAKKSDFLIVSLQPNNSCTSGIRKGEDST